jgi:hypothetical protein
MPVDANDIFRTSENSFLRQFKVPVYRGVSPQPIYIVAGRSASGMVWLFCTDFVTTKGRGGGRKGNSPYCYWGGRHLLSPVL